MLELLCVTIAVGGPLLLGLIAGSVTEGNHLRRLAQREAANRDFTVTQLRSFPWYDGARPPTIVMAEVVVGTDYFKNFLASWRKLFGGEVRSYTIVIDRARREALLRLIEKARAQGYNALCNVRLESADMAGSNTGQRMAVGAMLATATAYTVPSRG